MGNKYNHRDKVLVLYELGHKQCSKCKKIKPLDQFSKSIKERLLIPYASHCKKCMSEYSKMRYKAKILGRYADKR
jgi:hypothetical protein